jgi:hypothetical protein
MRPPLKSGNDGHVSAQAMVTQADQPGPPGDLSRYRGDDIDDARRELAAADSRGDRLAVRLAAARQECAQWRAAAAEAEREKDAMISTIARLQDSIGSQDIRITAMAEEMRRSGREAEDRYRRADESQPVVNTAQAPAIDPEQKKQAAGLTRRLRAAEEDAALQRSLVNLLLAMLQVLSDPGRWWLALLPGFWVRNIKSDRLRRKALFDTALYAKRYPDVSQSGMDPLHHYVLHGLEEGRVRV